MWRVGIDASHRWCADTTRTSGISSLKDAETASKLALNQFAGQVIAGPRNAAYAAVDNRLVILKERFQNGQLPAANYWTGVAHLVASKQ